MVSVVLEIKLNDDVVDRFKKSYDKDLIRNANVKEYMKSVDELVHECIRAFMKTDFVMEHGGVLLDISKHNK